MAGFYSLTPKALFEKARREVVEFHETGALERLFDACCSLNHLRDWICPDAENRHKLPSWPNWPEERFANELWNMMEYQIVRGLCNRAKHFVITKKGHDPTTDTIHGARVGLARCGDSLGQTYFMVGLDGVADHDVRDALQTLIRKYLAFFDAEAGRQ